MHYQSVDPQAQLPGRIDGAYPAVDRPCVYVRRLCALRHNLLISPDYSVAMIIALACCAGCVKYRIHLPFMLLSGALCLTGCMFGA